MTLWPDPKTVLSDSSSVSTKTKSGAGLWPDPVGVVGKAPVVKQTPAQQAGFNPSDIQVPKQGTAANFMSGLGDAFKTVGKTALELPKGMFYDPFAHPSQTEQQFEQVANKTAGPVATTIVKPLTRFFEPIAEGLGNTVASIIFDRQTAKSLAENRTVQTVGHQAQPQLTQNLQSGKLTPEDYVSAIMNSANVGLAIAGAVTDFLGIAGDRLATKGQNLKVTPEQITQVLKSDISMPPEARVVLEHLKEKGQGFDLNLKRPAGGLRQTVGEALGGTAERATTFKPTGDVNPQIAAPEPFAHETAPFALDQLENTRGVQPFAHEATIPEPRVSPFAEELAGGVGGANTVYRAGQPFDPSKMTDFGLSVAKNKSTAEIFGGNQRGIQELNINLDAKILTDIPKSIKVDENFDENITNYAREHGYDVIDISELGVDEMRVINPNVIEPSGSTTLTAEIVPGLSKTIEEDIIPKARGAAQRVSDIYKELATLINPTGQVDPAALDIIMKNKGDFERKVFRAEQTQKAIKKAWDKQPEENRLAFMEKVETGQLVEGENKALADSYRERLNNAYSTISKYKDVNFLENYFPHFWQKPDAVRKDFIPEIQARRPLGGTASFLKQRIFQTIQEGIEAGYKPVTANPEELIQIYEQSVAKFQMAQQMKLDLKAAGLFKYVQKGKPRPPGYAPIDDKIARVYFPQGEFEVSPEYKVKTNLEAGQFYAPEPVARLINNHLSPDMLQNSPTYRTAMQAKNSLNAIQLGFSGFHILFTTLDSLITGVDVGISKLARGDIAGAAKEFAKAPFNALTFFRDGQKFYNGDPELLKIEEDLFRGGASLKEKQYYKNQVFDRFIANVRGGNYIGALGRLPMAAIEGMMRPLFSYYIPRLKVGAFRELFSNELERYALKKSPKSRETIAREVWNNIENRLGELNYDNLFWNRNFKSANMLMWRAVGWNLGTIREIGGAAVQDFSQFVKDAGTGKKPDLTSKMRYTLALLFTMATIGSIYEYLHTGHGPKSAKDMFYPENGATDQNGDAVRVQFPTYLKDMYAYAHHPTRTIGDKLSPELAILIDLWGNEDYFGNYVYDPNSGLPQKLADSLKFVINQIKPMSVSNVIQLQKGNATVAEQAESFLGIQKSPQDISQSERTKAIFDSLQEQGPKTPDEQKLSKLKNEYRKKIQQGDIPSLQEMIDKGLVTNAKGYRAFIKAAQLTPVERAFKTLPKATKAIIPSE